MPNTDDLLFKAGIDLTQFAADKKALIREVLGMDEQFQKGGDGIATAFSRAISEQKLAIKDIESELKKVYAEADKMAPGKAQASVLGGAVKIEGDLGLAKQQVDDLSRLKDALSATGGAADTFTTKFTQARNKLKELNLAKDLGQPINQQEYAAAVKSVEDLGRSSFESNRQVRLLSQGGIAGLTNNLGILSGGLAAGQALMGLFGSDNEDLNKIMLKTQALLSVSVTLQQISNKENAQGGVIAGIVAFQEKLKAKATVEGTVATQGATIAQRAFNLIANANPYVLLATAIISVVGAIYLYISANSAASASAQKLSELNGKIADSLAEPLFKYKTLQAQFLALEGNLVAQTKLVKDNKDVFHELGYEVGNVSDAENIFKKNSASFIESLTLRAKAAAYAQDAMDNFKKSINDEREYKRKYIDKNLTTGEKALNLADIGGIGARADNRLDAETLRKEKQAYQDSFAENLKLQQQADANDKANSFKKYVKEDKEKKPKKTKAEKAQELEEVFPLGSVIELEKRVARWNDALQRVKTDAKGNQTIDVLAEDKFGKNYKTGEVISVEEAKKRLESDAAILAAARKKIAIQTAEEQLKDIKQQISDRDKLLQDGISKDVVDKLFPEVAGKKYIDILNDTEKALTSLLNSGKGTDQTQKGLQAVREELEKYKGLQSFTDSVSESIDNLKSKFSGTELITKLKGFGNITAGNQTEDQSAEKNRAIKTAIDDELKANEKKYQDLLAEQKTYEEQSAQLTKDYEQIKKSDAYLNGSSKDKAKIDNVYSQKATDLFLDTVQKSEEFSRLFTNMNAVATEQLEQFKQILIKKLTEAKTAEEKIKIGEFINRIDEVLVRRNPFKIISESIEKYIDNLKRVKEAQQEYNKAVKDFGGVSDEAKAAKKKLNDTQTDANSSKIAAADAVSKGAGEALKFIGDAKGIITDIKGSFDDLGLSLDNGFGDALDKYSGYLDGIQMQMDGIIKAAEGFASGNPVAIVAGAVKIIGGVIKSVSSLFNNDRKKERGIQEQAKALKQLEQAYNAVAFAAERAFGSSKYSGQRDLINNLEQQQRAIQEQLRLEGSKKKKDQDKINGYNSQIQSIGQQITVLKEGIIKDVLQTDIPDMASKIGDALLAAFGKGEDGVKAVNDAFDNMVKNILRNQLNKVLEDQMKGVYANILKAAGFKADGTGNFDGFTDAEIADLKLQVQAAATNGQKFIDAYSQLFGGLDNQASTLSGAIKGITSDEAGVLAGQMNGIRINQGESLKNDKFAMDISRNQLLSIIQIEVNTRLLYNEFYEYNKRLKGKGF